MSSAATVLPRDPDPPLDKAGSPPEWLYRRCHTTLRPALAGRLGSVDDADDVLHEAFARFLSFYAGQPVRNPLAMLARIAMNIVRDAGRARTLRRAVLARQVEPLCAIAPPPDPEEDLADKQRLRRLCDAIDGLPPRCREAFLLHRIEGLPQAEVARILGISLSGVEKHLMRANSQLRLELNPTGGTIDRQASPVA